MPPLVAVGALAAALLVGVLAGKLVFGTGTKEHVPVIVREGPVALAPGDDAVVLVEAGVVEQAIVDGLRQAEVPGTLTDISAELGETGIAISARNEFEVAGFPVSARFSTTAHPHAGPDGAVLADLSDTRVLGGRLPGSVQGLIEDIVNDELTRAVRPEGYRVNEIEVGEGVLVVHLVLEPGLLGANGLE